MKEIKKCSISGLSFRMEEEAWVLLNDYIESLKANYRDTPDGGEITADIEARIAELILSTQDSDRVVERPLVANIIAQLGSAEDILEESTPDSDERRTPHGEPRIPRRLYRDMDNARLGGVCSGLAKYFGVEAVWLRLAALSPLLLIFVSVPFVRWDVGASLFWVVCICYLVMWFAVPAARTPRQKLEASGERITVHSIRDTSAEISRDVDKKARPVIAETVTLFGRLFILLMKIFAAAVFLALTLLALALLIALCIVIFAGPELFGRMGLPGDILLNMDGGMLLAVLGIVFLLLPALLVLYVLACLLLGSKPNRAALLVMFLLWIATIVALPVITVKSGARAGIDYSYHDDDRMDEHERMMDSIERVAEHYLLSETDFPTGPDAE